MAAPRVEIPEVVLASTGGPVSGATVQVNFRGAGAATVYTAEVGATTSANPITTDANGRIEGWLEEGSYDLVVTGSGLTTYTQALEAVRGNNSPGKLSTTTGDLVYASSANNLARLAVGSTGQSLTVVAGLPAWGNAGAGAPVTSLPGSPTDGQQSILVDSTSAPTYAWLLQWSATASKWIFLGGSSAYAEVATAETLNNAAYTALSTAGPSFTVPRAGDYIVEIGADIEDSTFPNASQTWGYMSYDIGGTGAVDADAVRMVITGTGGTVNNEYGGSVSRAKKKSGLAASTALVAKYTNKNTGNFASFSNRWIRVTPVAVT